MITLISLLRQAQEAISLAQNLAVVCHPESNTTQLCNHDL